MKSAVILFGLALLKVGFARLVKMLLDRSRRVRTLTEVSTTNDGLPVSSTGMTLRSANAVLTMGIILVVLTFLPGVFLLIHCIITGQSIWFGIALVLFSLLGWGSIAEYFRVRHELRDDTISYRGLFRSYARVDWTDIQSAYWNPSMKWLVLDASDGRRMRFAVFLKGIDALSFHVLRHPHISMTPATHQVLRTAASGQLPNFM